MIRRATQGVLVILALATPALAQDAKATAGFNVGWSFNDGVSGNALKAPDGNTYNRLDPKDAFDWNAALGFLVTHNAEVGFRFGMQKSTPEAGGTNTADLGYLALSNYHGYFAYNFGESDAPMRPYFMVGLGMTHFSDVSTTVGGGSHTLPGASRFSTIWGGGVKYYPNPKAGVQFGVAWVPTYIKSDATGWWCDPWWGCYLVGNAQYANQFKLEGGVTLKF